jgi:hypothetical protein
MKLTKTDVISTYNYLKKKASKYIDADDVNLSLKYIELSAKWAYAFNYFYADKNLEEILFLNAEKISQSTYMNFDFKPIEGRYLLIDTNGSDNHGLTQQYIRAFISKGIEFAYINEDPNLNSKKIILDELNAYPKATIYLFDKEYSSIEKTKMICKFLCEYKPEKYLMHIMPWDVVAIMVCHLINKSVISYNINATDHAFWLGASCINYSIEFRHYGYTVSMEKRGLRPEQLLLLPYYPIVNQIPFMGLPDSILSDNIKIFSGGAAYKIYGDLYFEIVKKILFDNPNAVLIYAGAPTIILKNFIKKNHLQKRVYLIGNRQDIYQLFEDCDVYLGTYPICGGLMSQYAAICGKPILAYTNCELVMNFIEDIVCHEDSLQITHTELDDFFTYTNKICSNIEFRKAQGAMLKKCVITPSDFNNELHYLLINNKTERLPNKINIDYDYFSQIYLDMENKFSPIAQKTIVARLRYKALFIIPKSFFSAVLSLIKTKITSVLKSHFC